MNNSAFSSATLLPDSTPLTTNGMRSNTHLSVSFEKRNADNCDGPDHPSPTPHSNAARKSDIKHKERYSHREFDSKQTALDPTVQLSNSLSSLTLPFSDNHIDVDVHVDVHVDADHDVDKGDSKLEQEQVDAKKKSRRKSKTSSKTAKGISHSQSAEMNDRHKSMDSSASSLDRRRRRDDVSKPLQTKAITDKKKSKDKRTLQVQHESSNETELEPSNSDLASNSFDDRSDTTPNVSNTDANTNKRPASVSVPVPVLQRSPSTTTTTTTTPPSPQELPVVQQVPQIRQGPSNTEVSTKSQLLRRYSNPATMTSQEPGFVTLPEALTVILPSGPLGVAFKNQNNTTVVWSLKEDSPVLFQIKVGMVVDTLNLPADGIELRGLGSAELCKAINSSTDMEGRFLLLKSPFSPRLPKLATSKILLPPEGNSDDLGLVIVGDPAKLKQVAPTSPLHGKAVAGQQILALGLGDGTAYLKLRSFELKDVLQDTCGIQGRFLVLKNLKQRTSPTIAAPAAAAAAVPPPPVKVVNERPGFFKSISQRWGSSRSLLGLDDSRSRPVRRLSFGGFSVNNDRLSVSSHDLSTKSTRRPTAQRRYSNTELVATGFLTYPKSLSVVLPTGHLGVVFQNQNDTTVVLCMKEDSPMLIDLVAGMVVDTLTLPGGNELRGLCTTELCKALNSTSECEGRRLLLKSPHSPELPAIATTKIMLHALGDGGDLGLHVDGYPAAVTAIASTSPLAGMVLEGQQIVSIGLTSGVEHNMPTSPEVQSLLQNAPSFLLLKNLTQRIPKLQQSESSCGVVIQGSQRFRRVVARRWSSSGIDMTMDDGSASSRRFDSSSSYSGGTRLSIRKAANTSYNLEGLQVSSGGKSDESHSILYKNLVIPMHQRNYGETSQEQADVTIDESEKERRKSNRKKKKSSRRSTSLESPKGLGSESDTLPASTLDELVDSSRGSKRRRSRRHRDLPDVSSTVAISTSQVLRSKTKPGLDVGVASEMLDQS
jgi:hypothetical protein